MTGGTAVADGCVSALPARVPCTHRHGPPLEAVRYVNGVRIDPLPATALSACVTELVRCGAGHVVQFLSADPTTLARRDSVYREVLNSGAVNLADGVAVVAALRLLAAGRNASPAATASTSYSAPIPTGSASLPLRWRGGRRAPGCPARPRVSREPDRGSRIPAVRADRRRARRGGLSSGSRRPEPTSCGSVLGLRRHYVRRPVAELGAAPVVLCVGAAFDFLSGAKRRSPVWMQEAGLEGCIGSPASPGACGRRYLIGNPRFAAGSSAMSSVVGRGDDAFNPSVFGHSGE